MNENTYGSRLLIAMEAKNATRKDLATALGVSVQAVGDVLRGKSGAFTAENNANSRPKGIAGLGIREWTCSECGSVHDRDVNAARNILARGHARLAVGIPVL